MSGIEVALIAGTAMQAAGSVMKGVEQSKAAAFEEQQLKTQAQMYKTAAAQDEAKRREDLVSSLESIQAIQAGRGVGAASPTSMAILDNVSDKGERDIRTARINLLTRADQSRMAAEMAGDKAQVSLLSGFLGAGSAIADAGFKYNKIKTY